MQVLDDKKEPRKMLGAVGNISSEEIFSFSTIKIQDPSTFCSK
jgi:hypothetical protein